MQDSYQRKILKEKSFFSIIHLKFIFYNKISLCFSQYFKINKSKMTYLFLLFSVSPHFFHKCHPINPFLNYILKYIKKTTENYFHKTFSAVHCFRVMKFVAFYDCDYRDCSHNISELTDWPCFDSFSISWPLHKNCHIVHRLR